jgi:Kef-type K+ transport system membrane component KefB
MIEVDATSFLIVVTVACLAAVTAAVLPSRLAPPVVVLEVMLGIVVGPDVLSIAEDDDFI